MIYFDLETTVDGGPDANEPDAHWRNNEVLLCGYNKNGTTWIDWDTDDLAKLIEEDIQEYGQCTLCAHNAKFDLKYLMREHPDLEWQSVRVWDTMTWQYRHQGHQAMFPSLEDTAKYWGIHTKKTLDLGALLSQGIKMQDIPKDQLSAYLETDIELLVRIAQEQMNTGEWYWMDYLLPLAEMELHGLRIDRTEAVQMSLQLNSDVLTVWTEMVDYIKDNCEWQDGSPIVDDDFSDTIGVKSKCIKPFANRTLSHLLFGEPFELKITNKWRAKLKSTPLIPHPSVYYTDKPTHIGYPVDSDKLDEIEAHEGQLRVLELTREYRKASKLLGTYVQPFLTTSKVQGTVHPALNTAVTATGRLSSSKPNGQNMPSEARQLVIAQTGYEIEELDFSQLEMVGAATVSGCSDLIIDLSRGLDVHQQTAAKVFGAAQAEEKRKLAKNVNFGVLYGGKAPGLSRQTGVDKDTIQQLIDAFYSRYPGVAHHQRKIYEEVIDNMVEYDVKDGEQRYCSDWTLPQSNRKFRFIENKAPMWLRRRLGRKWSFSPNHTANYPIQGFAGGDIVMFALWTMWNEVRTLQLPVDFILTVHDSIVMMKKRGLGLDPIYKNACFLTEQEFNLPVHLEYDVTTGPSWQ